MVNTKPATNPGEEAVDCRDERQDCEYVAKDLTSNDKAKNGALGEGM
jgi:hypothetical protein